jgi:hypothetical protein
MVCLKKYEFIIPNLLFTASDDVTNQISGFLCPGTSSTWTRNSAPQERHCKKFKAPFSLAEKWGPGFVLLTCATNLGQRSCCSCGPQWMRYSDK